MQKGHISHSFCQPGGSRSRLDRRGRRRFLRRRAAAGAGHPGGDRPAGWSAQARWCRRSGSNRRPAAYKAAALPLSYGGDGPNCTPPRRFSRLIQLSPVSKGKHDEPHRFRVCKSVARCSRFGPCGNTGAIDSKSGRQPSSLPSFAELLGVTTAAAGAACCSRRSFSRRLGPWRSALVEPFGPMAYASSAVSTRERLLQSNRRNCRQR
jgi:hypothetical protein